MIFGTKISIGISLQVSTTKPSVQCYNMNKSPIGNKQTKEGRREMEMQQIE